MPPKKKKSESPVRTNAESCGYESSSSAFEESRNTIDRKTEAQVDILETVDIEQLVEEPVKAKEGYSPLDLPPIEILSESGVHSDDSQSSDLDQLDSDVADEHADEAEPPETTEDEDELEGDDAPENHDLKAIARRHLPGASRNFGSEDSADSEPETRPIVGSKRKTYQFPPFGTKRKRIYEVQSGVKQPDPERLKTDGVDYTRSWYPKAHRRLK
ncbi:hypothetical protein BDN72DRAFT_861801 [Pluteus cervinus]|uniref:Uncharacterized protein n=1 Tax=Pluteus cervinus TaxID=181527 RepID=A0ACD3AD93_9AGAR|nr:hypothetical protein BDN72DRAFT_861801 [Pluteus cervinus]